MAGFRGPHAQPITLTSLLARLREEERGVISVITAFIMVALVGMLALSVDVGYAYGQRRMAQNVADSGAVAAAHVIAAHLKAGGQSVFTDADVAAAIRDVARTTSGGFIASFTGTYVDVNGSSLGIAVGTGQCSTGTAGCIPTNARGVRLVPRKTFPSFFGRTIGVANLNAGASATAIADQVSGFNTLSPSFMPYALWVGEDGLDHQQTQPQSDPNIPDLRCRDSSGNLLQQIDPYTQQLDYVYGCIQPGTAAATTRIYRDNGYSGQPNVSQGNPRWEGNSNDFKGFLRLETTGPILDIGDNVTAGGNAQGQEDEYKDHLRTCYLQNQAQPGTCTLVMPLADRATGNGSNVHVRIVGWASVEPLEDPTTLPSSAAWHVRVLNAPIEYGAVDTGTPPPVGATIISPRLVR